MSYPDAFDITPTILETVSFKAPAIEADIDLRGGPDGVGRARGRGRFRS